MKQHEEFDEGDKMYGLIEKLFPICRSITGNGVRKSLEIIKEIIPLQIIEIPSGEKVFDWKVPKEWNIKDAWIKNSKSEKIVDFKNSNLHIMSYSIPIHKKMPLKELKNYLYTIEEHPKWIPYKTSYYKENWGFCITHELLEKLPDDEYEVFIDSTLQNGSLTYGEFYKPGKKTDEILISCYVCHPSMCNDNLSGVSLVSYLAKILERIETKFSYRFLFVPETIGAITWLSENEEKIGRIKSGFVVTCVGDQGQLTYKKTRYGNSQIDKIVEKVLKESNEPYSIKDFFPYGSDERQFSSPGINLPMGSLMRTQYHKFPEYHTSADNLDFISSNCLENTLEKYLKIIEYIEDEKDLVTPIIEKIEDDNEEHYLNCNPKCEPNLGKRGLYRQIHEKEIKINDIAILWILNYSDGVHSLRKISELSELDYNIIKETAKILEKENLLSLIDKK